MMPPDCCLCGDDALKKGGGLVRFALRKSDEDWRLRKRETSMVGHPPWQRWFCPAHRDAAEALCEQTVDVAMARLSDSA